MSEDVKAGPLLRQAAHDWKYGIDPRALQGKTARKLQLQAEREMERRDKAARDQMERMAKVVAKSGVTQEELQRAVDLKDKELKRVQKSLYETERDLSEARRPRRAAKYDGKGLELRFAPAVSESSYYSKWTIEELESVLMHMRMSGADDSSIVTGTDTGLSVEIKDDGLPLQQWKSPRRPAVPVKFPWWIKHKAFALGTAIGSATVIFCAGLGFGSLL